MARHDESLPEFDWAAYKRDCFLLHALAVCWLHGVKVNPVVAIDSPEDCDPDLPCNKNKCSRIYRACCGGCDELTAYKERRAE